MSAASAKAMLLEAGALCPLCNSGAVDSIRHRCWQCPTILSAGLPEVEMSSHLAADALHGVPGLRCLYERGMVPAKMLLIPPPAHEASIRVFGELRRYGPDLRSGQKIRVPGTNTWFLDESGGYRYFC